ncbi:hypothetical protein BC834DRAFT_972863 [Gloeopeniophorella convolvens]|nr:hypothetical protein BC834DRAFT_972863 [Gloeopeniophorella convolvens]
MSLSCHSLQCAIVCEESELRAYNTRYDGLSTISAFIASEAGKRFKVVALNTSYQHYLSLDVYIDGRLVERRLLSPGCRSDIEGIRPESSIPIVFPFKFQELELIDTDTEDAPAVPEMGTIEIRAFRSLLLHDNAYYPVLIQGLHQGRISEKSKKAGWHHVSISGDSPIVKPARQVLVQFIDPPHAPFASMKIFYRPREILKAQGIIPPRIDDFHGGDYFTPQGQKRTREDSFPCPPAKRFAPEDKQKGGDYFTPQGQKRTREDSFPCPPAKRFAPEDKQKGEYSANVRARRIRELQVSNNHRPPQ